MGKKTALITAILLVFLTGCETTPVEPKPETGNPAQAGTEDPLEAARKQLFEEIGIKENTPVAPAGSATLLPAVLPTPPALPQTDAETPAATVKE